MRTIRALHSDIIFQFVDKHTYYQGKLVFEEQKSEGGLYIPSSFDKSLKEARWVNIISVGPNVKDVLPGMKVLVDALKWTEGFKLDDIYYWKTNEENVIGIEDV